MAWGSGNGLAEFSKDSAQGTGDTGGVGRWGEQAGNGGCDVAANSDRAQAGSSDCAMGIGNRPAEFGWDWAWSMGNRPGGIGSSVGAVMADTAGSSTEGMGSGGIMGFSGA